MKGPAVEITERLDAELRQAARRGDANALRDLLRRGAGVASPDDEGWTSLMLAAASRSAECLRLLLPLVDASQRSRDGASALTIAAEMGWAEGVELLLSAIESGPRGAQKLRAALARRDQGGKTPLIAAAKAKSAACARLLLPQSDSRARDIDGRTALMWAAAGAEAGAVECVEALVLSSECKARDSRGWTALDWAVTCGSPEVVERLAPRIDPLAPGKDERSPFDRACERGGDEGERIRRALRRAIADRERGELDEAAGGSGEAAGGALRPRSL